MNAYELAAEIVSDMFVVADETGDPRDLAAARAAYADLSQEL